MVSDFLDLNGKWQCTRCGACCQNVRSILPQFATASGRCMHLAIDYDAPEKTYCSIYSGRPSVCYAWPAPGVTDREMAKLCDLLLTLAKNT